MSILNHIADQLNKNMHVLSLVKGTENGEPVWAYVKIPLDKYLDFQVAQQNPDGYSLEYYGEVLPQHGKGEAPPLAVQGEMEKQGFNPEFSRAIGEAIAANIKTLGIKPDEAIDTIGISRLFPGGKGAGHRAA